MLRVKAREANVMNVLRPSAAQSVNTCIAMKTGEKLVLHAHNQPPLTSVVNAKSIRKKTRSFVKGWMICIRYMNVEKEE